MEMFSASCISHRQVGLERGEALDRAHVQPRSLEELAAYPPLFSRGAQQRLVGGELFSGTWLDVGTVERLSALEAYLAAKYARG